MLLLKLSVINTFILLISIYEYGCLPPSRHACPSGSGGLQCEPMLRDIAAPFLTHKQTSTCTRAHPASQCVILALAFSKRGHAPEDII